MISSWGFSVIINLPPEVTMSIIGLYSRAYSPPTSTVQGLLTCYCWGDRRGAPATSSASPALNSCASLTIPLSFTLQCQQLMPLLKLEKHINMESPKFIVAVLFTISEFVSIYNPQFYEDHSNWSLLPLRGYPWRKVMVSFSDSSNVSRGCSTCRLLRCGVQGIPDVVPLSYVCWFINLPSGYD